METERIDVAEVIRKRYGLDTPHKYMVVATEKMYDFPPQCGGREHVIVVASSSNEAIETAKKTINPEWFFTAHIREAVE